MSDAGTTKTTFKSILKSFRPSGISKNLFIFAPLVFAQKLNDLALALTVLISFVIFSILASGVYLFNDVIDRENDRLHPEKSLRPIAAGHIGISFALAMAALLVTGALASAYYVDRSFFSLALAYGIINVLYTFIFKKLVIIDVMAISFGFVIRVLIGAAVIHVAASDWIILCTFLLALFLGFAKRRYELVLMKADAPKIRTVLDHYSVLFLDQITSILAAVTIFAYVMYTMSDKTIEMFGTHELIYTTPMVVFGIFRYLYLIHKKEVGGSPTTEIFGDLPMVVNLAVWSAAIYYLVYLR